MAAGSGWRGCQARRSVSWPGFYTLPLPGLGFQVPFAEWVNEGAFFEIHITSPPAPAPIIPTPRAQPAAQGPIPALTPAGSQEGGLGSKAFFVASPFPLEFKPDRCLIHSFLQQNINQAPMYPALFWALEPHRCIKQRGPCSQEADTGLGEETKPASRCTAVYPRLGSTLERVIKEGLPEEGVCELEGAAASQAQCWSMGERESSSWGSPV